MSKEIILSGQIIKIFAEQIVGNNGFKKREFVIKTRDQYPQVIKCEMQKDQCVYLDNYTEGEYVDVKVNIKGREYTDQSGKTSYFTTIHAWFIGNSVSQDPIAQPVAKPAAQTAPPATAQVQAANDDDLPF